MRFTQPRFEPLLHFTHERLELKYPHPISQFVLGASEKAREILELVDTILRVHIAPTDKQEQCKATLHFGFEKRIDTACRAHIDVVEERRIKLQLALA